MDREVIIVGQGLAGSVLALTLLMAGYKVHVIDSPGASSSSRVAAGIWNPIVFKRLTQSWRAEELLPELYRFYGEAGHLLRSPLIRGRRIIKPFTEEQETALWRKKSGHPFLDPEIRHGLAISDRDTIDTYAYVLNSGNLDVPLFLEKTRERLIRDDAYSAEAFDYGQLQYQSEELLYYKGIKAERIVFCEGHLVSQNPFFGWLRLKPAKGEVLTIRCEGLLLEQDILNKGIFILPLGEQRYKVGATYDWADLSDTPTEAARQELLAKLSALISVPFEVLKQEAGVRPAAIDRRPIVGAHPDFKNHFVFNGFGTKAVMLAPYFARQLAGHFSHGKPLDPEVSPSRFYEI